VSRGSKLINIDWGEGQTKGKTIGFDEEDLATYLFGNSRPSHKFICAYRHQYLFFDSCKRWTVNSCGYLLLLYVFLFPSSFLHRESFSRFCYKMMSCRFVVQRASVNHLDSQLLFQIRFHDCRPLRESMFYLFIFSIFFFESFSRSFMPHLVAFPFSLISFVLLFQNACQIVPLKPLTGHG
jgi:hypothetical protein